MDRLRIVRPQDLTPDLVRRLHRCGHLVPLRANGEDWVTTDISLHIGNRLTERRLRLRLSLADVAQRCGVTLQQIHRYETGANTISAPMLWALSQCLEVEVAYFFDGLVVEKT